MSAGNDRTGDFRASFDKDAGVDNTTLERRDRKVRAEFWEKFRKVAGLIPFADDLVAAYYCAIDAQTPARVRGMLLGALAYFILPIDAIPDFIFGFGYTDDAAVLAAAISMVSSHILPRHRAAAAKALGKDFPEDDGSSQT